MAVDIGGSLIKVVYFDVAREALVFAKFETTQVGEFVNFMIEKQLNEKARQLVATGGGSFRFSEILEHKLGMVLVKMDELSCLVHGSNLLLQHFENEAFSFQNWKRQYLSSSDPVFPYLLVNIGSGVSILRVDSEDSFKRISGSSVGGGTFWGLAKLLTNVESFDEALQLTRLGSNRKVDMLVGDIYGTDYQNLGKDVIASSFGKASYLHPRTLEERATKEDIAHSLLLTVCNNLGQIAHLNARTEGLQRIYFAGYFIRDHDITMQAISDAVCFWSGSQMQAFFFKHEGFLGALGALVSCVPSDPAQ